MKSVSYTNKIVRVFVFAAELNKLDGVTATNKELNYVDGVTSNIQTQLNGKVPTSRTINGKALTGNITLTATNVGAISYGTDRTEIPENADLNDYTNIGCYACSYNPNVATLTNCPTNRAFLLDVISSTGTTESFEESGWNSVIQRLYDYTGPMYFRRIEQVTGSTSPTYYDWEMVYTTQNKPTAAEIGALSTTGGFVTGTITSIYNFRTSYITNSFLNGNSGGSLIDSTATPGSYVSLARLNSTNGVFTIAVYEDNLRIQYTDQEKIDSDQNGLTWSIAINESGDMQVPGDINCGYLNGVATHVKGTLMNPSTVTSYQIPFYLNTSTGHKQLYQHNGLTYRTIEGTTSALGYSMIVLGNGYAEGTAGNKYGLIRMYGNGQYYTQLQVGTPTANRAITFPNSNGTVALTTSNVSSASKLQTARTISLSGDASGSTTFDGSKNVTLSVTVKDDSHNHTIANIDNLQSTLDGKLSTSGTAAKATKLATARTISLTGDVTGSTTFDGSGNKSITCTVANNSHNHTIANITNLQSTLNGKVPNSHTTESGLHVAVQSSTPSTSRLWAW